VANNKEKVIDKSKKTDEPRRWCENQRSSDREHITVGEINRNATAHGCTLDLMEESLFFEVDHGVG
jgi:hypothetical protein